MQVSHTGVQWLLKDIYNDYYIYSVKIVVIKKYWTVSKQWIYFLYSYRVTVKKKNLLSLEKWINYSEEKG